MAILVLADTGNVVGDIAVRLTCTRRTAEIGYTLGREHWGKGYATEAVEELLAYLCDEMGAARVSALQHHDNIATAPDLVADEC